MLPNCSRILENFVAKREILVGYHELISSISLRIFVQNVYCVVEVQLLVAAHLRLKMNGIYDGIGTFIVPLRQDADLHSSTCTGHHPWRG